MSLSADFAKLFDGRKDAYGSGRGGVIRACPSVGHYADHLDGDGSGLGIFPLRDDGTVMFGAIDLDEPNFELARALQKLIPNTSWVERSRSGNAHVWVFFKEPCPAWAVRAVLRWALESLGRRDVEIFPKQDELRPGGLGNYINLPYHGEDRPILHPQLGDDGRYTVAMFAGEALATRQDPQAWVRRARTIGAKPPEEREATSEWGESPVLHACADHILENMHSNPLRPGHRAQVLFHVSVQLLNWRDLSEADARKLVHQLNEAGTHPVPRAEVDRQFDNALRGRFTATGCDDPVMAPYVLPDCPIANGRAGR